MPSVLPRWSFVWILLVIDVVGFLARPCPAHAQDRTRDAVEQGVEVRITGDYGALFPLYHQIQFGKNGTDFDYVRNGGQDAAFPVWRTSVLLNLYGRHHVTLLYQPLVLSTKVALDRPLSVDGERFDAGSAVDLDYGFPFYRISYAYDVLAGEQWRLDLGGSLQLRDATITFTSANGEQRRSRRDLGPVPALKALLRHDAQSGWFSQFEIDGMYAPVKYINGGDSDVVGAIIDANLRAGYRINQGIDAFVNLRWLGGGAEGTSEPEGFSDGYSQNWLQFLILSVGADVVLL